MDKTAGLEVVVSGAAGAVPDAVMDQAPGVVAIATDKAQRQQRPKRAAADAMSPGHLASTAAVSSAEKRVQHAILGVDKEFRDKVKGAGSPPEITRDVRELQDVMRQVIQAAQGLQTNDFEQEAEMVLALQRVEDLDPS